MMESGRYWDSNGPLIFGDRRKHFHNDVTSLPNHLSGVQSTRKAGLQPMSFSTLFDLQALEKLPLPRDSEESECSKDTPTAAARLEGADPGATLGDASLPAKGGEESSSDTENDGRVLKVLKEDPVALAPEAASGLPAIPEVSPDKEAEAPSRRRRAPLAPGAKAPFPRTFTSPAALEGGNLAPPGSTPEGHSYEAMQRRRLRKAKRRKKEAHALKLQGDLAGAKAAFRAAAALEAAARRPPPRALKPEPNAQPQHFAGAKRLGRHGHREFLEVTPGVVFEIPQFYDELAPALKLPTISQVAIDERVLAGRLRTSDMRTLLDTERRSRQTRLLLAASAKKRRLLPPAQAAGPRSRTWGASRPRDFGNRQAPRSAAALAAENGDSGQASARKPLQQTRKNTASGESGEENPVELNAVTDEAVRDRHDATKVPHPRDWAQLTKLKVRDEEDSEATEDEAAGPAEDNSLREQLPSENDSRGESTPSPVAGTRISGLSIGRGSVGPLSRDQLLRKPKELAKLAQEEAEKVAKCWLSIARKEIPRWHRHLLVSHRKLLQESKRLADFCQREVKGRTVRLLKVARAAPIRTRRLAREMVIFWKKVDREQAEVKRKEDREAVEARRREEDLREARRQQQRLNFLLTQTELYSHFMNTKLAGAGPSPISLPDSQAQGKAGVEGAPKISEEELAEETRLKEEALLAAQAAAQQQLQRTNAFDSESDRLRGADAQAGTAPGRAPLPGGEQIDTRAPDGVQDIDLLNPSTMPAMSSVSQPTMFKGRLKEYQLKGLQWLVNLYEQGLNGILADEMGLGKTIQGMSFLAHLAEEKNIWGPFLVVAPASVLSNWADEVQRFCPAMKILPYWGGLQERTVLRKNINPKRLYRRDAPFHILITSYQLLVLDEKYFRRVKWQYMVLDEAQAIKSASSQRWKTLLSFNCRNRLLLSGTPIQNSMAELWALLHFIMPTLFDSHEQFNEWFSKGIEGHAEHGGTLNEHQLTRLHSILKPFMLRRVKKDVESEMTNKREVVVHCALNSRQVALYRAIKNKISVADLFDSAAGGLNEKKMLNLMNIVIQLRKVCNHPELFERNEGRSFLHFAAVPHSLAPPPFGETQDVYYAGHRNPVSYEIPKLLYRDGMHQLPLRSRGSLLRLREHILENTLSIFCPANIQHSLFSRQEPSATPTVSRGAFDFTRFINLSPAELAFLATASDIERWLFWVLEEEREAGWLARQELFAGGTDSDDPEARSHSKAVLRMLKLAPASRASVLLEKQPIPDVDTPFAALVTGSGARMLQHTGLLRSCKAFTPPALAPQIDVHCSDRDFAYQRQETLHSPGLKRLLLGFARTSQENGPPLPLPPHPLIQDIEEEAHRPRPLLSVPFHIFGASPPMQSFDFAKMLTDSGKLQMLDVLLKQLRADGHRVLLFAQMTKMLNILEDYMNYRKYKYLRLDGSSTITDRRDMVKDFQHKPDIFCFLLSTRAGGLGINLTAADTVIFYESDWNPTMDLQAMDRAHRLGQTREVSVYRMICQGTVEEKIVKRASQKNTVQQLVMTGGAGAGGGDVFEAEEVVSLLLEDAELEQQLKDQAVKAKDRKKSKKGGAGFVGGSRGVRLDAEGEGSTMVLEDAAPQTSSAQVGNASTEGAPEEDSVKPSKKRKAAGEPKPPKPPKVPRTQTPRVRAPRKPKLTGVTTKPDVEGLPESKPGADSDNLLPVDVAASKSRDEDESAGANAAHVKEAAAAPAVKQRRKSKDSSKAASAKKAKAVLSESPAGLPADAAGSPAAGEAAGDAGPMTVPDVCQEELAGPPTHEEAADTSDAPSNPKQKPPRGAAIARPRSRLPKKAKVHEEGAAPVVSPVDGDGDQGGGAKPATASQDAKPTKRRSHTAAGSHPKLEGAPGPGRLGPRHAAHLSQ